jgi:hypothetical protein
MYRPNNWSCGVSCILVAFTIQIMICIPDHLNIIQRSLIWQLDYSGIQVPSVNLFCDESTKPNPEYFQGAIMESLDYPLSQDNLLEDEALTCGVARKLSPSTFCSTKDPMTLLPDVLSPDKMMSLTLRADSENNQVKYMYSHFWVLLVRKRQQWTSECQISPDFEWSIWMVSGIQIQDR